MHFKVRQLHKYGKYSCRLKKAEGTSKLQMQKQRTMQVFYVIRTVGKCKKNGSVSLIERVILSAGAMLIFSVSFQIDHMPEGEEKRLFKIYICVTISPREKRAVKRSASAPRLAHTTHGPGDAHGSTASGSTRRLQPQPYCLFCFALFQDRDEILQQDVQIKYSM